ncbi:winged helix-turn-helix transcriptional regulator [Methanoculleus sp. Wushi-C6]|uniref:Winged helix-turn-helix transcriptional regulator n=1 Tax=Methanoculleus caldifontis TaxID=2651577 RepID=A0ABU3WYY9_9EURY|nr:winged helix-turn-helix transcriptional regulator [Methanoculleus sp. Wushi-C6]MDV2481001.1 winged helix-turn-helix transcriptional regulator [Methanoculleus sp. Wushi-C6]
MSNPLPLVRSTLLFIVFLSAITPGSAVGTGNSEWEFPEAISDDTTPEYIWNVPLKLVLLDFVFMTAPLLFLPVQFLIAAAAWLWLGHRRISRKNALDHDTRRAAYLCIRENPGINHATLSRMLGVNIGTLRYHLATLCETGKILAERDHGQLRYYANGRAAREGEGYPLNGTRKQILDLLAQDPGMMRKEVASALGIAGASVTWHMALLIREGAVRSERDGRMMRYFPRRDVVSRADRGVDVTG